MANANQVIINGETILDLRSDTVTPETLQKGYTAHDKSGAKITGTLEASSSGGAKETWVLNREVAFPESVLASGQSVTYSISFGARYVNTTTGAIILAPHTSITFRIDLDGVEPFVYQLFYDSDLIYGTNKDDGVLHMGDINSILTFNTPPTGDLLTWLQANGVKQPDDTAVQDTKALTITSNGTVSITPDLPYDAVKKVDVTVDVASGGGTETTSVDVYGSSETIDLPIFCTWQTANGWLGTSEFELTNSNGDVLFTIPDVLVGGYIVFTKDPMNQSFFNVARVSGVEVLDVNPMPSSGDIANASIVVKVVEPGANFELYVSSV